MINLGFLDICWDSYRVSAMSIVPFGYYAFAYKYEITIHTYMWKHSTWMVLCQAPDATSCSVWEYLILPDATLRSVWYLIVLDAVPFRYCTFTRKYVWWNHTSVWKRSTWTVLRLFQALRHVASGSIRRMIYLAACFKARSQTLPPLPFHTVNIWERWSAFIHFTSLISHISGWQRLWDV